MTDANEHPPSFDFGPGRPKLSPPYVLNSCHEYERAVSGGKPELLTEQQRFSIMQAYFAGFAKSASFLDMLFHDPEAKAAYKLVTDAIKKELADFSRMNREFGSKIGTGHVRVKS